MQMLLGISLREGKGKKTLCNNHTMNNHQSERYHQSAIHTKRDKVEPMDGDPRPLEVAAPSSEASAAKDEE